MIDKLKREVKALSDAKRAEVLKRFFKTGKGEYGEGDIFVGLTVPQSRQIARSYKNLPFSEIKKLLKSKVHEERLIALLILIQNFQKGDKKTKAKIYDFYLSSTRYVNNWDLVDLTASKIVGEYLLDKEKRELFKLAKSKNIWERRIAIIATFAFIKRGSLEPTFEIAKLLLEDQHDLMHKAVGWMLREAGKRDQIRLEEFLKLNYKKIPRTTLRYAIERFPEEKRKAFLKFNF